jgi:DNA-binding GntR family transcriptional regulator
MKARDARGGARTKRASSNNHSVDRPRYQQIADELMAAIRTGAYPVGVRLPTEIELCVRYGISRSTVREGLRQLRDAGLISRRRGIGTEVVARTRPASYRQPTNSIADLLQYADDTQVTILSDKRVICDARLANFLECQEGRAWLRINSLRVIPGDPQPICMTTAYVDARLPHIKEHLEGMTGPISALLEDKYDIRIARVEQGIQAIRLGKQQAKLLRAEAGSPALQAVRRYYRQNGTLIELSTTTHPGDRFTYVTSLVRD